MDPLQPQPTKNTVFGSALNKQNNPRRFLLTLTVLLLTLVAILTVLVYLFTDKKDENIAVTEAIRGEVAVVSLTESGVTPSTIKVLSGQQVTFLNNDTVGHQMYADPEYLQEFDSVETLSPGSSYTYVFDTPGTYNYYDPANNIKYRGTVEVR